MVLSKRVLKRFYIDHRKFEQGTLRADAGIATSPKMELGMSAAQVHQAKRKAAGNDSSGTHQPQAGSGDTQTKTAGSRARKDRAWAKWPFEATPERIKHLDTRENSPKGWERTVWSDEVTWTPTIVIWNNTKWDYSVSRFPFVPGYFVTTFERPVDDGTVFTKVVAGPFKRFKEAELAYRMLAKEM